MMQNYEDLNSNTYTTQDQISDLQKKINLVEGDLKAYQDQSSEHQRQNKHTIQRLRKECKELHKALAERLEADALVIDQAFDNANNRIQKARVAELQDSSNKNEQSHGAGDNAHTKRLRNMRIRSADAKERTALRNKSGEAANELIDQALCDQKKRLNAMKAETLKKRAQLKDLETTYDQLVKEASFSVEMSKGESRSAQKLTSLENRLDIAKRKSAEATHINKVYQLLHQHLQDANLTSPGVLNDLETQIRKSKVELEDIRRMYEDAQKSRDVARSELITTEEKISNQRRIYEKQLSELREKAAKVQRQARTADFHKKSNHNQTAQSDVTGGEAERFTVFSEKSNKTGAGTNATNRRSEFGNSTLDERMLTMDEYDQSVIVLEQNQKIDELEQHFQKIKEVTGVSELSMIVARFEDQAKTHTELEEKRQANILETERLTKELLEAKARLNEQKYGDSGSDSKRQKFKADLEIANEELKRKRQATLEIEIKADETKKLVNNLTHALANLTEKLERVNLDKSEAKQPILSGFKPLDPESIDEETVADLFKRANSRVEKLLSSLPKKEELDAVLDTAKTDDVYLSALENRMPSHNVRITNLNREGTNATENGGMAAADEPTSAKPIKKPEQAGRNMADDSESGEDNHDFFSRDQIKKQGQSIIDNRSKKRAVRSRAGKRKGFGKF